MLAFNRPDIQMLLELICRSWPATSFKGQKVVVSWLYRSRHGCEGCSLHCDFVGTQRGCDAIRCKHIVHLAIADHRRCCEICIFDIRIGSFVSPGHGDARRKRHYSSATRLTMWTEDRKGIRKHGLHMNICMLTELSGEDTARTLTDLVSVA